MPEPVPTARAAQRSRPAKAEHRTTRKTKLRAMDGESLAFDEMDVTPTPALS